MARSFAGNQNITKGSGVTGIDSTQRTLGLRLRVPSGGAGVVLNLASSIAANQAGDAVLISAVSGSTYRVQYNYRWTTNGLWVGNTVLDCDEWHCVHISYDRSSTSNVPIIYTNGVSTGLASSTAPTGASPKSGLVAYRFGENVSSASDFTGQMAEFGFWDTILEEGKILGMGTANLCPLFCPQNLRLYLPLAGISSPETEIMQSANGTVNSATFYEHPPMTYPYSYT